MSVKVLTHYLHREVHGNNFGDNFRANFRDLFSYLFRDLFRDFFRYLGAVSRSVTTITKFGAAGILARAVSVRVTGALAGDQPQPEEEDHCAELQCTIHTCRT